MINKNAQQQNNTTTPFFRPYNQREQKKKLFLNGNFLLVIGLKILKLKRNDENEKGDYKTVSV